jgi:hypothetical protein
MSISGIRPDCRPARNIYHTFDCIFPVGKQKTIHLPVLSEIFPVVGKIAANRFEIDRIFSHSDSE